MKYAKVFVWEVSWKRHTLGMIWISPRETRATVTDLEMSSLEFCPFDTARASVLSILSRNAGGDFQFPSPVCHYRPSRCRLWAPKPSWHWGNRDMEANFRSPTRGSLSKG